MFSEVSSPYNAYPQQLYGGFTGSGIMGGDVFGGDVFGGDVFGGRAKRRRHRRPTAKQLRALAKGRAKLRAMRRMKGGAARRRYKSSMPKSLSQQGVDRAVMEKAKIINRLRFEYGWGDRPGQQDATPAAYPLINRLNNIQNYLNRATAMGLVPSFPDQALPPGWAKALTVMQNGNVQSKVSSVAGPLNPMNPSIRGLIKSMAPNASAADITNAIRGYKRGLYDTMVSLPPYVPNSFANAAAAMQRQQAIQGHGHAE